MQTTQWKKVEKHFHKSLELNPTEQMEYLKDLESSDSDLAQSVRKLLDSHYSTGNFLEDSILEDTMAIPDERIGKWKIIREIGKGGMSTVYLAERADDSFSRYVAIKFLYGLAPGREMHNRMKREQNILASLNHPYICRLLDAGIHSNGRPYFIMEYIDGLPIDLWCTSQKLSLRNRLYLFNQVCEAVSYAHQRFIVHRDIKPSNILVNKEGVVKLLDFGIAKIVGDDQPNISRTKTGREVLTPEFASPEQFKNQMITTATDVYSLGKLLYLLLTDKMPFNFENKSSYEISKTITEMEPVRPSQKVAEISSNSSVSKTTTIANVTDRDAIKSLQGDLDNIIIKALQKDPNRRYQSAEKLRTDILNYLENKPVSAQPDSFAYLTKKFIQRHKIPVASAFAVSVFLMGSTLFSLWQTQEANSQRAIAQERAQEVRQLANSLIFDLHDSIANLPGSTPAREHIVGEALTYLDQLAQTENADPELLLDLAAAYRKIGDVQGNPTNSNLGRHSEAIDNYQKGIAFVHTVLEEEPTNVRGRELLANIFEKIGDVQGVLGNLEDAEESRLQSMNIYKELAEEFPDSPYRKFTYSISLIKLGDLTGNPNFSNLNNREESLQLYQQAGHILSPVYNNNPENTDYIKYMGIIYERMGTQYDSLQKLEESIWCFEESMQLREKLIELEPMNTEAIRDMAVAHEKMGDVFKYSEQLDNSLEHYEEAFQLFNWLAESDPQNSLAQQSLAISHIHLGDLHYHPDQPSFNSPDQSREHFNQSKRILLSLKQSNTTSSRIDFLLGLIDQRLQAI